MSYLVLARKSRPQDFSEVIGQRTVVTTLQNSIKRGRVAHAILFSGVRGVGKTTLARIMAKAINCQGGVDNPPCNRCQSCRDINAGASLDLYEIDGASNRGIQEIRELKEKIRFLPVSGAHRVIIIDEVHMLTPEAFNALLKTLEEPPEHVYFIFATTEQQKIPITILSRCQRFELKRVTSGELRAHFTRLAEREGIAIEAAAMSLIVREAEGSVRDGLSLLDQVLSFGEETITAQDVIEVLGLVNRQVLHRLAEALLLGQTGVALAALAEIFAFGMDVKRFGADLLAYFRHLMLCKIDGCDGLLDLPEEEMTALRHLAEGHNLATIHQKLTLLMRLVEDIRHSNQPRLALECGFLAIIEAGNVEPVADLLQKLDNALAGHALPLPPVSRPVSTSVARPAPEAATLAAKPPTEPPAVPSTELSTPVPPPMSEPVPEAPATQPSLKPLPEPSLASLPAAPADFSKRWPLFIAELHHQRPWMAQLLEAAPCERRGETIFLHFKEASQGAILKRPEHERALCGYLRDFFQEELGVACLAPQEAPDLDQDETRRRRQRLIDDPLTQAVVKMFGGGISDIRLGKP
ncbi:MAG: DNA polymerase III subunit gamma/tau [Desulfobulbaceae bacterium]|jgi:DNA polymerase-3 subunit gamma/tau|nr:DNA polymerase III subunit gamma/tau [Desulfobulbaceae bacterium]